LALVRRLGAQHAVDHGKAGYLDEVNRLSGGQGVPVILEMLANVNLGKDLGILAKHGRVVIGSAARSEAHRRRDPRNEHAQREPARARHHPRRPGPTDWPEACQTPKAQCGFTGGRSLAQAQDSLCVPGLRPQGGQVARALP
jgi:threonine dehydrogenase-like Zn-dependent dehydrogenase